MLSHQSTENAHSYFSKEGGKAPKPPDNYFDTIFRV